MSGRRSKLDRLRREGFAGGVATVRRRGSMATDRVWATAWKRVGPAPAAQAFDGEARFAVLTVNFSTTRYLRLMLLTLSTQHDLHRVQRIVVVDNDSRDGGPELLDRLAEAVPRLHVVHRRHRLSHGVGMRAAVRALDRLDRQDDEPANVLLFCDTDVVFRSPGALRAIAEPFAAGGAAIVGEVRASANALPDIQASLFAVRRDVLARRDVAPLVHDGAPAYRMQRSVWDAGLPVVHVPTNHGGLTLHRGRAGVDAAARHHPHHEYARVRSRAPHYMGVPGGAAIWAAIEAEHAQLLDPTADDELIELLARRLRAQDPSSS